jgi:hypothetical protein
MGGSIILTASSTSIQHDSQHPSLIMSLIPQLPVSVLEQDRLNVSLLLHTVGCRLILLSSSTDSASKAA